MAMGTRSEARTGSTLRALLITVVCATGAIVLGSPTFAEGGQGSTAIAFGAGTYGQLGNNATGNSAAPVAVDTSGVLAGKSVTRVTAGGSHSCVVADGKAYCWGRNDIGQLGDGSNSDATTPVVVDTSGVLAGKTVSDISGGTSHTCAVADGKAYCWGDGWDGQLGWGTSFVGAGQSNRPLAVNTSGVLAGRTVSDVSAGTRHSCAVADGKAYCWGSFALGSGSTTTSPVPVAVDDTGVLANKTVTDISAGSGYTCAVADGRPYCWGGTSTPTAVDTTGVLAGKTVAAIDVGGWSDPENGFVHVCAVADGKAFCWGNGGGEEEWNGQLGDGSAGGSPVPVAVDTSGPLSGKTVTTVSAGSRSSCATASGKAYCWGYNAAGQLGNNNTEQSLVPVAVDTSGVISTGIISAISVGGSHVIALREESAPMTVPGAPTAISVTAGDSQVSVAWAAPADDGGSPILEYQVISTPGNHTCAATDASNACLVGGLQNGTGYTFQVRARNSQGWSEPSATSGVVTPTAIAAPQPTTPPPAANESPVLSAPPPVSKVRAVKRKNKVTVTWKPAPGASAYKVRISSPGGKKYLPWQTINTAQFKTKIAKGKRYRVQIIAVGAGGQGPMKTFKFRS